MKTAIIADIHGNSPALRAVLADAREQGCERLIVLGDVIPGYDPAGCMRLIAEWPAHLCIRGNAEAYLLTPHLESSLGGAAPFRKQLDRELNWWKNCLDAAQLAEIRTWPDLLFFEGALLVHDNPLDRLYPSRWKKGNIPDEYQEIEFHSPGLRLNSPVEKYAEIDAWMEASGTGLVLVGHTHEAFIQTLPNGRVCNAGSCGLPLQNSPDPSWVMAEGELGRGCRLEVRNVRYAYSVYLEMIDRAQDHPQWQIPGRAQAVKRMVETGRHWRFFVRPEDEHAWPD